jgi:hypothetical protein
MADRPSFGALLKLLKELFVDMLRYEQAYYDMTRRAEFSDSARAGSAWSVAEGGGVRICAISRAGGGFWRSTFESLFRLHPESIVFVWSDIDHSVRIYYRARAQGGKPYRSLLPHTVRGPRSETLATWAVRFGVCDPDPNEPPYVNYERFQSVMDASPKELLDRFDPFRWENRDEWVPRFGVDQWWESHSEADTRFLQPIEGHSRRRGGRRSVRGLHEACLRMFPMYVAGREDVWLAYDDYSVERRDDGEWRVTLEMALKQRVREDDHDPGEIVTRRRFERVCSFPPVDDRGRFRVDGRLWRFRARAGVSLEREAESNESSNRSQSPSLEVLDAWEDEKAEKRVEEAESEAADVELDEASEGASLTPSSFDEVWRDASALAVEESDEPDRPFAFLDPVDAFTYGVGRRFSSLVHHLYHRSIEHDRTLEEHVRAILDEQWDSGRHERHQVRDDRSPPPLLDRSFWHEQFEFVSKAGLEQSELGQTIEAHAVSRIEAQAERTDAPDWACQVSPCDREDRWLPVGRSVPHPVRSTFVRDPEHSTSSPPARAVVEETTGRAEAEAAARAAHYANHATLERVLVRPGDVPAWDLRRDVADRWASLVSHHVFERILPPGRPIGSVLDLRDTDSDPERRRRWRWVGKCRERSASEVSDASSVSEQLYARLCWREVPGLDPETGVVQPGTWVEGGQPLALRTALDPPTSKPSGTDLVAKLFFGDDADTMERLKDRSWYVPEGVRGRVEAVDVHGDSERDLWVRVRIASPLRIRPGCRIETSMGLGATVRTLTNREDMPFDREGRPVDAVLTLPDEAFDDGMARQSDAAPVVFDGCDGQIVDVCRLVRDVEATVTSPPELRSEDRRTQPNIRGRSIHELDETSDAPSNGAWSSHRLAVELVRGGADTAARALVERLDGHVGGTHDLREPVGSAKTRLRFRQLLGAFGVELWSGDEDRRAAIESNPASLRLRAPRPDARTEILDHPTETLNYRTGDVKEGGLFDRSHFDPLPKDILEFGEVTVERRDARRVPGDEVEMNHAGPTTLHVPEGAGRGLGYIELPEPMLNPLAEEAVAEFFGMQVEALVDFVCGERALELHERPDGTVDWACVERRDTVTEATGEAEPEPSRSRFFGAEGLRTVLNRLAERDERAEFLREAFWDYLPVLPPEWRPLRMDDGYGSDARETSSDETLKLSSDRNWLYLRIAHTVSRLDHVLDECSVPIVLCALRRRLRRKIHELYGTMGMSTRRGTPRGGRRRTDSDIDLPHPLEPAERGDWRESVGLSHLLRRHVADRLLLREEGLVPESIRGHWSPMTNSDARSKPRETPRSSESDVRLPASLLLDAWSEAVAESLMEDEDRTAPEAFAVVETRREEAFGALKQVSKRAPAVGYLFSEEGEVEAVRWEMAPPNSCIELSPRLVDELDLQEHSEVMVYLPVDDEVRREAADIVSTPGSMSSQSAHDAALHSDAIEALERSQSDEESTDEPEYLWQLGVLESLQQAVRACCGGKGSIEIETRDLYSSILLGDTFEEDAASETDASREPSRMEANGGTDDDASETDALRETFVPEPRVEADGGTDDDASETDVSEPRVEADGGTDDGASVAPSDEDESEEEEANPGTRAKGSIADGDDAVVAGSLAETWQTLVELTRDVDASSEVDTTDETSCFPSDVGESSASKAESDSEGLEDVVARDEVSNGSDDGESVADEADESSEPPEYVVLDEPEPPVDPEDGVDDREDRDVSDETPDSERAQGDSIEGPSNEDGDDTRSEPARARLVVERNGEVGTVFPVEDRTVTVGTFNIDAGVFPDIDLEHQDRFDRISDEHCILHWEGERWYLEDVGSEHGTSHNRSERLPVGEPVPLEDGDEIIVGKLFLRFEMVDEETT